MHINVNNKRYMYRILDFRDFGVPEFQSPDVCRRKNRKGGKSF